MPNRYIRESINASEIVCSLDWAAECFYRRLLLVVDDFGRYEVSRELRSRCYPIHDNVRASDISRWIAACAKAGLIAFYDLDREWAFEELPAGKKSWLVLPKTEEPRARHSKYPQPPKSVGEKYELWRSCECDAPKCSCQRMFTRVDTCTHMRPITSTFPITSNDNEDGGDTPPREAFGEIPSEAEAIAATMNAGIPQDFSKYVFDDWSVRGGKDASGNVVQWLQYVTKRWSRERVEWQNGTHRGKPKASSNAQRPEGVPTRVEVNSYAREKWGDDSRCGNWAASFYGHWSDAKQDWKRNGKLIDWKIELTSQVAKWRTT